MKKGCLFATVACFCAVFALAKDFWEKPFTQWKKDEAVRMLQKSPWAGQHVFTRYLTGPGTGVAGEKELHDTYTVRFFSALPIRQAYVRLFQIAKNYDKMPEEGRRQMDASTDLTLHMDMSKVIIVALEFTGNDRQFEMEVRRVLQYSTTAQLKTVAYLITDRRERVELNEYHPPSRDGTGAKFIFPRIVDGEPAVSPTDKNVTFEFEVPETNHRILVTWKVNKMIYNGELAL